MTLNNGIKAVASPIVAALVGALLSGAVSFSIFMFSEHDVRAREEQEIVNRLTSLEASAKRYDDADLRLQAELHQRTDDLGHDIHDAQKDIVTCSNLLTRTVAQLEDVRAELASLESRLGVTDGIQGEHRLR